MASIISRDCTLRLPPALRPGQRVGVFAPAARGATRFPERFARGVRALAAALDCEVVVPANMETPGERLAGSSRHRAAVFGELVQDPSIGAIFTAYGGLNTNEILAHIDWDAVRTNPKIIVGYSDTSALLLAIQAKAGLVTYYGPAILPQFGEIPEPLPYTVNALRRVILHGRGGAMEIPEIWYDQGADWSNGDGPRRHQPATPLECIRPGRASGPLFGGNVSTLNFLIGTPFFRPPDEPFLFFIEMVDAEAGWFSLRRSLTHFRDTGLLGHVAGLIVGRSPQTGTMAELSELLLDVSCDYDFPIVANVPFGHTDPIATLPIGVRAMVASSAEHCVIELHTPTVAVPQ